MKTNAIVRIILFSLALLILGSVLLGVIAFGLFSFDFRNSESEHHISSEMTGNSMQFHPGDFCAIDIKWVAGSITVLPGTEDWITVEESHVSDNKYAMHVTQSGDTLSIQFCQESISYIGINDNEFEAKDLLITVPAGWVCDSLEIDAAAADVEISDLTIREVEFDGASAVCGFHNCQVEKLDVDTVSGDVTFSGALEVLDFDAMSARFNGAFLNVPQGIDLNSMSGNLQISLPEDTGFALSLNTISGDFSSDFPVNTVNNRYECGNARCQINVSTMSGDVDIQKNN